MPGAIPARAGQMQFLLRTTLLLTLFRFWVQDLTLLSIVLSSVASVCLGIASNPTAAICIGPEPVHYMIANSGTKICNCPSSLPMHFAGQTGFYAGWSGSLPSNWTFYGSATYSWDFVPEPGKCYDNIEVWLHSDQAGNGDHPYTAIEFVKLGQSDCPKTEPPGGGGGGS